MAATALALFGNAARASCGDRLAKIVLFGSRARGDGRSGSDLDIAVVLRDLADKIADRNRLADLAYEAIVETSLDIQAVPVSLDEWDHPDHHSNPALIRAIKRDGKVVDVGNEGPEAKMAVVTVSERKARRAALKRSAVARVMDELKTYAAAHGGRFLVFGSVATGKVKFDSDFDVVVDFSGWAGKRRDRIRRGRMRGQLTAVRRVCQDDIERSVSCAHLASSGHPEMSDARWMEVEVDVSESPVARPSACAVFPV
jgi:predicted nucleotidyltransferase